MSIAHLSLEFAPQGKRQSIGALLFFTVATFTFLVVAAYAGTTYYQNSIRKKDLAILDRQLGKPISAPIVRPPRSDAAETARAQFVRSTSRNLSAPWADLMTALEKAPSNVALLSVEPSAIKRSVALTAEAANPGDMINYLQALQSDSYLADVVLVSHQLQLQTPGTPLRFHIRASWGNKP